MKATIGTSIRFTPSLCCGRRDFTYVLGNVKRAGVPIEAWVVLTCDHCGTQTRVLGYCKQAGDGEGLDRQRRHRKNVVRKVVSPSTGVSMQVVSAASVASNG